MISTAKNRKRTRFPIALIVAVILCALTALLVISFFDRLPIEGSSLAIDWRAIWTGIAHGQVTYTTGLVSPPWIALVLSPLGLLSVQASWGILSLITLIAAFVSVPRPPIHAKIKVRRLYLVSILLLTISWPLLRQLADGNLEVLVISGVCLILYGLRIQNAAWLAAGALMITVKPQECWLLLVLLGIYVLTRWPMWKWLNTVLLCAVFIIPTFVWLGPAWLNADFGYPGPGRGTIIDMTWQATLNRIGVPGWLALIGWMAILGVTIYIAWISRRTFDRQKAGALIAASLLLAPYAAGNSILTVLAVGIIPLFQIKPRQGLILILLCDAPILMPSAFQFQYGADFATLTTLILWGALCRAVLQSVRTDQSLHLAEKQIMAANGVSNS